MDDLYEKSDLSQLLEVAKKATLKALTALSSAKLDSIEYGFLPDLSREMKAGVDKLLEDVILDSLLPTGIPILSEEAGETFLECESPLKWIVDPLDGTVNFVRGCASSAVSIALWSGERPLFGVVGEFPGNSIYWGGKQFGAFKEEARIHVSKIRAINESIICTGFPSRFNLDSNNIHKFIENCSRYGKVRMFGSASISLLRVASGSVDAYYEEEIMMWDVAAGLAIVEGAGGSFEMREGAHLNSKVVFAGNDVVMQIRKD